MVLTLRGVAAAMESVGSTMSTVTETHTLHMNRVTAVNSNIFHTRFGERFEDVSQSLAVGRRNLSVPPEAKPSVLGLGLEAGSCLRVALDSFVLQNDPGEFRRYVAEAHDRAIPRLQLQDRESRGRQSLSSLVSFRYLAFSLAAGKFDDAWEMAEALANGIERRLGGHGWVDAMGQFFIYLTLNDLDRVTRAASQVDRLEPSVAGSAIAYARLARAIVARSHSDAARAVEAVLAAHPIDCGEGWHFEYWVSGQIVCAYGLAMVNAGAMHGFRVPLNGDAQIPEPLVIVPPLSGLTQE